MTLSTSVVLLCVWISCVLIGSLVDLSVYCSGFQMFFSPYPKAPTCRHLLPSKTALPGPQSTSGELGLGFRLGI